jgi:hypothetical protein
LPAIPSPQRDPQALAILAQVMNAAGGETTLSAINDFTASGVIVYYWPVEGAQGPVTVCGKGLSRFRVDATLPTGVRSWAVNDGSGSTNETDGTVTLIPYHNATNLGSLTFPLAHVLAALRDSGTNIRYLGLVTVDGRQAHQVRVEPFATEGDPGNMISKLNAKDFFIDSATYQIASMRHMMHPDGNSTIDYPHEIEFSDYRAIDGLLVPFSMMEKIGGNRAWTIQLVQVTFNSAPPDTIFQL